MLTKTKIPRQYAHKTNIPRQYAHKDEDPQAVCSQRRRSLGSMFTKTNPNQKNIYGAALALIAIMYGSMQGIIAVASLLATMHNPGNGMDPQ